MVYGNISEGKKNKVRGRPFTKGHKLRKSNVDILASKRSETSAEGRIVIDKEQEKEIITRKKEDIESEHELIESISFKNGENDLTIRFYKRTNRMYGVKIFLNENTEIRPCTYVGASTGFGFWNLLKGSLKR